MTAYLTTCRSCPDVADCVISDRCLHAPAPLKFQIVGSDTGYKPQTTIHFAFDTVQGIPGFRVVSVGVPTAARVTIRADAEKAMRIAAIIVDALQRARDPIPVITEGDNRAALAHEYFTHP